MTLHDVLRALRKHWWIVLVVTVLCTATTTGLALRATPIYEGTVTFFARTPPSAETSALAGDQFGQQRVNTYVKLLGSQRLAERVHSMTGVDVSVPDLMKEIDGTADLNTVLLTATVHDSSRERVGTIVTSLATEFPALVKEIETQDAADSQAPVDLEVVSGPLVKPYPVSPVKKLWVGVGLLLGLFLGAALALLRALSDRTVRTEETLRRVTQEPILGRLPVEEAAKRGRVLIQNDESFARPEAFRQLRTNLQFVDIDKPVSVLVVTSAMAGEGKSSTAANLAVSFAEAGKRVLLVEADLRRPALAEVFGLEGAVGLTNVLVGQVALQEVVQPWGREGLHFLASGPVPPNPSELLGSQHMVDLIAEARRHYDLVIIDTAPLLPVTDGAIASARADGVLLVVRYGKTRNAEVERAVDLLRAVDARVLGTVLNRIPLRGGVEGYSYRTYRYEAQSRASLAQKASNGTRRGVVRREQDRTKRKASSERR